jgi:hypothetical protein
LDDEKLLQRCVPLKNMTAADSLLKQKAASKPVFVS